MRAVRRHARAPGPADRLRENQAEILKRFEDEVQQDVPVAREKSRAQLADSLPAFLESLAEVLDEPNDERTWAVVEMLSQDHGEHRATLPGYGIEEVLNEYRVLRRVLLRTLLAAGPLDLSAETLLNEVVDRAMAKSAARFVSLQHSELQDTLERLEHERELRIRFVTSLSHDLRNPLAAAKGAAQVTQRLPGQSEQTLTLAKRIVDSISRTEKMIDDMLDASRVRAGQPLPLTFERCDLVRISRQAVEELALVHGPRFHVSAPDHPVECRCDPANVRRLLDNLLMNAVKYGAENRPITVRLSEQGPDWVRCSVHNWGEPIADEAREALFQPFHRLPRIGSSGKKGWGLGLTLVRGVVEAHGGRVEVASSPAEGATFTVLLPRHLR